MEFSEKDKQRFWAKVNKTEACWLWTRSTIPSGHAQAFMNGKLMYAHRVSWLLCGNTLPDGLCIRHKCRSANCVNPEHLETGTHLDNMADTIRDETSARGIKHHSCKLTEDQVRQIRLRNTEPQKVLAKEFGVTTPTINSILCKRTWSWLI